MMCALGFRFWGVRGARCGIGRLRAGKIEDFFWP